MRASSDHILTSHADSLPRPDALIEANRAREAGEAADECGCAYLAADTHVVLVLSYVNPGAVFRASLVVFKTRYHLLFFSLAWRALKGIATSFSPMPRNPPTPMINAVTRPSLSIRTSSTSPILLSDGS